MGGSSPRVFHTTPPQPALKARTTLYSLSVGGAEASQNGFGDLMPTKSVLRSAMAVPPECAIDRMRRQFSVLDALHRQIRAAGDAIAAGPDLRHAGLEIAIDHD